MATETEESYPGGFGQVSRTIGTLFRYLLLATTLFGIVVLGILLVYVANDAIQPLEADPGWHLTFLLAFVLPTVAVTGFLARRNRQALSAGISAIGMLVVGLMFGGGVAMTFIDIVPPLVWLAYVVAVAIPLVASVVLARFDHQVGFLVRFGVTAGLLVGALFVVPELILTLPTVPTDWTILLATLGVPVALLVGGYAARRSGRRIGALAGTAALAAAVVSGLLGPAIGLDSVPATILSTVALVPTALYVATVADDSSRNVGLSLPVVVIGGALLGAFVVDVVGFAGPPSWVDWQFLTNAHSSSSAAEAGFYPAIGGSLILMIVVAVLSFPLGVGTAVYLEEYAPDNRLTRFIDVNISNLAGVPSVVYGLLGLGVFVTYLGQPTGAALVAGATLGLLILPIVIISAREAIRSVPSSMREASYGMGATRWQTVSEVVLPRAFPGILTGTILALGRAIGETAPLIMVGVPAVTYALPGELSASIGAMPLQIYAWASLYAGEDFYTKAVPAGVVTLLVVLLAINSVAIVLRNRYQTER